VKGIDYATPGTKSKGNFKDRERRQVRNTNDITDIQPLKKSTTMKKRETNPLEPDY